MTRTNATFLPRRAVRRDSAIYQNALREAASRRARKRGEAAPPHPSESFWNESEARAAIGRRLLVIEEGGDGAGGCWACDCPVTETPDLEWTWFCPAANGMICDTCCHHEMDVDQTGLRAWSDEPCIGCEHCDDRYNAAYPPRAD